MFVDEVEIFVKAGDGGNGCVSFHRAKYVPNGGPDGGDGGRGGDVIFVSSQNVNTLSNFKYKKKYIARNGEDGKDCNRHGKDAEDLVILVPPGTLIKDKKTGRLLIDVKNSSRATLALGGRGGWGNSHFATPTRQAPKFAKSGIPGEEFDLVLELKLIADVGLVGFPNVGKSTLLSVISDARPKVSNYHFTTLVPNLGVVSSHGNSFVVADMPGLIEGASQGVGLGREFLRHIERTRLLVHVVDVSGIEGRDPIDDFEVINKEIREFSESLANKPQIIVANKIDLLSATKPLEKFRFEMESRGYKVFPISTATKAGVADLVNFLASEVAKLPIPEFEIPEDFIEDVLQSNLQEFTVEKVDGIYEVTGPKAERIVNSVDLDDFESLKYFEKSIKRSGIDRKLRELGAKEGDTVRICGIEFEYYE